jgi:hypothetical protein
MLKFKVTASFARLEKTRGAAIHGSTAETMIHG